MSLYKGDIKNWKIDINNFKDKLKNIKNKKELILYTQLNFSLTININIKQSRAINQFFQPMKI